MTRRDTRGREIGTCEHGDSERLRREGDARRFRARDDDDDDEDEADDAVGVVLRGDAVGVLVKAVRGERRGA